MFFLLLCSKHWICAKTLATEGNGVFLLLEGLVSPHPKAEISLPVPPTHPPLHVALVGMLVIVYIFLVPVSNFWGVKYLWPEYTCRGDLTILGWKYQSPSGVLGWLVWFFVFVSVSLQPWKRQNRHNQLEMLGSREWHFNFHHLKWVYLRTRLTELPLEKGNEEKKFLVFIKFKWLALSFVLFNNIYESMERNERKWEKNK